MTKRFIIIISAILALIIALIVGLVIFYNVSLSAVGGSEDKVIVVIENGTSSKGVVNKIYDVFKMTEKTLLEKYDKTNVLFF